jgi:hypothetical protein
MKALFALLVLTFTLTACSSDDTNIEDRLPPETQTGANTFGCIINGNLLLPRSGNNSIVFPQSGAILWGAGAPNPTAYFELEIKDYKSPKTASFLFHMHDIVALGLGSYVIDESNGMRDIDGFPHHYIYCTVFDNNTNSYQKYVSYTDSGSFTITKLLSNTANNNNGWIISGTFACKLRNINNPNNEIEIKKGRFDINSKTIEFKYFP